MKAPTGFHRRFRRRFGQALVQPGQVQQGSRLWCRCQVRVKKVLGRLRFKEVPEKVLEGVDGERGQVQRGSAGEGSAEGSGGGSRRSWCRGGPGSTTFRKRWRRRFQRRSWPGPIRFRKVPKKVSEDVGAKLQQGSGRFRRRFRKMLAQSRARFSEVPEGSGEGFGEGSGTPWCRGGPGSTRVQVGSGAIPGVCRRSF